MAANPDALPGGSSRFYSVVAIATAVVVFVGFARTYYLKGAFAVPELATLVHLHGVVMTLWFALFVVQARLVAARRVDLHQRLGLAGALLAALVIVVGFATAVAAARRGFTPGPPPLVFLVIPLADLLVFAVLIGAALLYRRRSDIHRRLMLLASVGLLTPAIARVPLETLQSGGLLLFFALADIAVLACVGYDTWNKRRLHPAFALGALLIIASQPLRLLLAGTPAWMRFATWLAG